MNMGFHQYKGAQETATTNAPYRKLPRQTAIGMANKDDVTTIILKKR
jgi:hypothetical protein